MWCGTGSTVTELGVILRNADMTGDAESGEVTGVDIAARKPETSAVS